MNIFYLAVVIPQTKDEWVFLPLYINVTKNQFLMQLDTVLSPSEDSSKILEPSTSSVLNVFNPKSGLFVFIFFGIG